MDIYARDPQNDRSKTFENDGLMSVVDYVTQKFIISVTTLRSFIPPQVRKITPKSRQICGYELCIIPKDMHIYLNIFITRLVTDLQHKSIGRHTYNSLFIITSAANYKEKVFPDGECFYDKIKDADQCITCLPIKPKNMINFRCAFLFYECTNCNIPNEELD